MSEALTAFRSAYLAANERFNERDFDAAFGGLSEELEWHPMDAWKGHSGVFRGRSELVRAYRELVEEFPDWQVEAREFLQLSDRVFAVRAFGSAKGRSSQVPIEQAFTQVWELDAAGTAIRVREYAGHEVPVEAAAENP
jgi:hypothetical protein